MANPCAMADPVDPTKPPCGNCTSCQLRAAQERIAELEREKSTLFGLNLGLCTAAGHSEHTCDVKFACADVERLRYTERNDQARDDLTLAMAEALICVLGRLSGEVSGVTINHTLNAQATLHNKLNRFRSTR